MPRVSRRKLVLELLDTTIRTQATLDTVFESDDEDTEDIQVSKRRRILLQSDSEESDEDNDGPEYPNTGEFDFQTKSVFIY